MENILFDYLRQLIETQDGKILFILAMIAVAMTIDMLTGIWSARMNPDIEPNSNKGINGILRKITSMMLMMFFIPISVLIPGDMGIPLIYTLYIGYLMMEILSVLENCEKMGIEIKLFVDFVNVIRNYDKKANKDENEDGL